MKKLHQHDMAKRMLTTTVSVGGIEQPAEVDLGVVVCADDVSHRLVHLQNEASTIANKRRTAGKYLGEAVSENGDFVMNLEKPRVTP